MTLRVRLAVLVAAIVAGAIAAAATTAYVLTARQLQGEVDGFLVERAGSMVPAGGAPILPRTPPGVFEPDAVVQFIDAGGELAYKVEGNPRLPIDAVDTEISRDADRSPAFRTVDVEGARYRVLTAPLLGGGAVQIGRSLAEVDAVLSGLGLRLIVAWIAGTALAAAVSFSLARRTMEPVERLTRAAEEIAATEELGDPIPVEGDDELARLALSFNSMLAALDSSRRKQRQLVIDAGHELRTPLTSLRTNIELLQRADSMDPAERASVLRDAVAELGELTELVTEVVDLATEHDHTEPPSQTTLREIAEAVVARARRRTGRTIEVVGNGNASITARTSMLERAVSNLVANAVKFSDGSIEIALNGRTLMVHDAGPGIPERERDKVFDRFYRSAEARTAPGSGLGLSIVKQVVDAHGGTVHVDTSARGGAAVGFTLPDA